MLLGERQIKPRRTQRQQLRDVVEKVMRLQAVTRCFIRNAEEALGSRFWGDFEVSNFPTEESPYEEKEENGKNKKKEKLALAFDTSFFKSQYEFTFPEKAIEVTLRRPEERSHPDIRFIRSMMMGILSFRRYSSPMQLMLARVVYYRRFGRGRIVVRKGHRGNSFYFVFSGVIAVTQDEDGSSALLDPEPILLHKGASFGDVALLKGLKRNATVICMEDTEFLVVDREEFFRNKLDQELQKELEYRVHFFRSLDLFSSWSDQSLEMLADHCKAEECHHSQVMVNDTSETKNIIFVTKGRCEVLRLVDLSQCPAFLRWTKQHEALLGKSMLTNPPGKPPALLNSAIPSIGPYDKHEARRSSAVRSPEKRRASGKREPYSLEDIVWRNGLTLSGPEAPVGLDLPRSLVAAVYLRIDSIHPGQYFSLTFLPIMEHRDPRTMVIISQGAEVIRIKMDKFSELADLPTLKKIKAEMCLYPRDNDLCRVFLEQNRWKIFKADLVSHLSSAPSARPSNPATHYPREGTGRVDNKRREADRRGILQLGTHNKGSVKFWTTPIKPKASEPGGKEQEQLPSIQTPIRLIHGIDIPKLCGKRIMW
ncbi:cyclic nucleotide-binding domain-containing protein 2-like isoform X3 [Ascaphus truei]|uniref:cyclic nucleotide-binding domain-containing protein 2-like isoform X3 n=1 Tax=Ascaphus truei TaxID=8439 RepID=UPI003F590DEE